MFYAASRFNQPLHSWDVGKVANMDVRLAQRASPPHRHAARAARTKLRSVAEGRADA